MRMYNGCSLLLCKKMLQISFFQNKFLKDLKTIFESISGDFESQSVGFIGECDYVDLLNNDLLKVYVPKCVNGLKAVSSPLI